MPSKIVYEKTPIQFYQFVCKDEGVSNTYVGSTVSWRARKSLHKSCCNNVNSPKYNYKVYQIIRANGGYDNWLMIEIHKQLCSDKRDSERLEQSLMNKLNSDMNSQRAFQTTEELQKHIQQYRADNRELINSKQKVKHTCCCGGKYTLCHKIQHADTKKHLAYIRQQSAEINI